MGGGDFRGASQGGQTGRVDYRGRVLTVDSSPSGFVFRSAPAEALDRFDANIIENAEPRHL